MHYLGGKKLSPLPKGITSKHHSHFHCLNCIHSFATENKSKYHKIFCENKDFCNAVMTYEDAKILEFNQNQKFDKATFIIYGDLECLIEKIDGCKNKPENSSISKVGEHFPSGFSISTISSFKNIENKHHGYRGKDCKKNICECFLLNIQ